MPAEKKFPHPVCVYANKNFRSPTSIISAVRGKTREGCAIKIKNSFFEKLAEA